MPLEMETLRGSERRRSIAPGNRCGSARGQALKIKPSECQQVGKHLQVGVLEARREVVKTWGRVAQGLESLMARHADDGAEREGTQEGAGTQTSVDAR